MSRQTRPTTVVSQPPRLSTCARSTRASRSHASWSASSLSADRSQHSVGDGPQMRAVLLELLGQPARARPRSHLLGRIRHPPDASPRGSCDGRPKRRHIDEYRNRGQAPQEDLCRRRPRRPGHQLRASASGRGLRTARPERRREVDDSRHAHDDGRARAPGRPSWPASTSSARRFRPGRSRASSSRRRSVDRALSGRRNLETHASLWRVPPADAQAAIDETAATLGLDRPARPARRAPTAEASGDGSRSPGRSSRSPGCSSSTSPRSASTRASAPSCSTSSPGSVIGWRRRSCSRRTTSTRPSASATGWRSCTGAHRRPRHAGARCAPSSAREIVELRVRERPGRGARPAPRERPRRRRRVRRRRDASRSRFTTDPIHARSPTISDLRSPRRSRRARAHARRRLPAPHRRPAARRRLTRKDDQ